MTALLQASYRGNVEIAQLLINSGANVNWSKHKQGYTALMFGALVRLMPMLTKKIVWKN